MKVNCVGVVSGSSSGSFEVAVALEGFGLVLWSSWRMALWCWNERGSCFGRFSLISVAGNMFLAVGAFLFGMVIRWGFLDFLDVLDSLQLMEEVMVLVWWRQPEVWV